MSKGRGMGSPSPTFSAGSRSEPKGRRRDDATVPSVLGGGEQLLSPRFPRGLTSIGTTDGPEGGILAYLLDSLTAYLR